MIEIVFAIVVYFIFIGFLIYKGKKNKTIKEMIDIEFGDRKTSDIDCGHAKTINDLPDEKSEDEE